MRNVFNVIAAREYKNNTGETRTVWTQIGVAFPARDGQGFDLQLYYMPVPQQEGVIRICIRPPMEQQDRDRNERGGPTVERRRTGSRDAPNGPRTEATEPDSSDDIPF